MGWTPRQPGYRSGHLGSVRGALRALPDTGLGCSARVWPALRGFGGPPSVRQRTDGGVAQWKTHPVGSQAERLPAQSETAAIPKTGPVVSLRWPSSPARRVIAVDEARHWIAVYGELVDFTSACGVDGARFHQRLHYWYLVMDYLLDTSKAEEAATLCHAGREP